MHRMSMRLTAGCVLAFALAVPAARGATPAEIDAAIARGQKFLLSQMKAPGRWEPEPKRRGHDHDWQRFQGDTWGGYTAVATYALLASGKSPQDEQLAAAVKFLKTADLVGVYALGMRAQVWSLLPQSAETRQLLAKDAAAILRTLNTKGRAAGLWDYDDPSPTGGRIDHSVSQFGVLGLWAASQNGADVNPKLWATFDDAWKNNQHPDGGWSYDGGPDDEGKPPTHTMTAAGIATLFITQEFLPDEAGIDCEGNPPNEEIDRALRWMSDNFEGVGGNNYLWYSIERIGAASGRKYFGGKDWYAAGAEDVVRAQLPNGSWKTKFSGASPVPDTALALLFLARGRAPVVMNKLDTAAAMGDWNQRPRDVANVTRWMGRQRERYFTWQVVDLNAGAQDLLDAPILYVSGSSELPFSEGEVAKLRQFVEDGGLILGNADCGKKAFAESFRKLGEDMFPAQKFRELPPTHTILAGQQFRAEKWKQRVSIQGLSNGVRELMLLLPSADAGRAWQQRADKSQEALFQLAGNLYLYATDQRTDRLKGQTHVVKDLGVTPAKTVKLARLDVGGNWDPEPGGWRRLALVMKNEQKVALEVTPVKLGEGKLNRTTANVAHLTGTEAFQLNAAQREELERFVLSGGTLVVDAAGGSPAFADASEKELVAIFGEAAAKALKTPVAPDHELFTNSAAPIKRVGYRRRLAQQATGELKGPRLRAIPIEKRLGIIFSREDISTGLIGHAVDGVAGYDPASATALMRNIILYAMTHP